jgi:hypothetical protein
LWDVGKYNYSTMVRNGNIEKQGVFEVGKKLKEDEKDD